MQSFTNGAIKSSAFFGFYAGPDVPLAAGKGGTEQGGIKISEEY